MQEVNTMAITVIDRTAEDNKYLHRDFHLILNRGVDHIGDRYGEDGVVAYIRAYVRNYFTKMTLEDIAAYLADIYEREEASDRLTLTRTAQQLSVRITKCPAVEYILASGDRPSRYYIHTTKTLYAELAAISGLSFSLASYDDATGAAAFTFTKTEGEGMS